MKKISLLFLVVAGLAGTSLYYAVQQCTAPPSKSTYYADYLPADTLAVISFFDLKGLARSFPQSAVGQFFAKPSFREILAEQGANQEALLDYESFYDGAADLLTNPFLQQLFGDDMTFALLKPNPLALRYTPEEELRRHLIAFGSAATGKLIAGIARLALQDFSQEQINGLQFTHIRLDDDEALYGYIQDGVILLAYYPELIVQALQQKKNKKSLQKQPYFVAAQKKWQEADAAHRYINMYCNLKELRPYLRQARYEEIADLLQGFKSLSSFAAIYQGNLQLRSAIEYDNHAIRKVLQQALTPQQNLSLSLVSEKTLCYSWLAGVDQELLAQLAPSLYNAVNQTLLEHLHLNLPQLMHALGPQAGFMMNGIANAAFFPLPKLSFFAQIRDADAAQQLLQTIRQRFAEKNIANEQHLEGPTSSIYYWSLLPAEAAHPAVALSTEMLYIANGEQHLKTLLTQEQQEKGLSSTVRTLLGAEVAAEIEHAGDAVFLARPALLAAEAKKADVWLNAAFENSTEKFRAAVLRVLSSVNVAVWYTKNAEHQIISTVFLQPVRAQE